jgi:hypothetical protein
MIKKHKAFTPDLPFLPFCISEGLKNAFAIFVVLGAFALSHKQLFVY